MEVFTFYIGDILHSFSFKDGFKKARKAHGFTQQSFADKFGISVETVKNWEQGRNVPELDTIKKLCQLFECNMDYLFNNITCKTHDAQFIQNTTGLSTESINRISCNNNHFLDVLISSNDYYEIDSLFSQLENTIHFFNSCYESLKQCEKKAENLKIESHEYKENDKLYFDLLHSSQRWAAEQTSNIYMMGILFGKILDEYKKNNLQTSEET